MTGPQLSPAPEFTEAEKATVERFEVAEEPEEVTAAKAAAQIPYMMENTREEFERVRDLAWPGLARAAALASPAPAPRAEEGQR